MPASATFRRKLFLCLPPQCGAGALGPSSLQAEIPQFVLKLVQSRLDGSLFKSRPCRPVTVFALRATSPRVSLSFPLLLMDLGPQISLFATAELSTPNVFALFPFRNINDSCLAVPSLSHFELRNTYTFYAQSGSLDSPLAELGSSMQRGGLHAFSFWFKEGVLGTSFLLSGPSLPFSQKVRRIQILPFPRFLS